MMNYFLMVTWFPAAITILERFKLKQKNFQSRLTQSPLECIVQSAKNIQNNTIKWIIKFPLLWILILGNYNIDMKNRALFYFMQNFRFTGSI